MGEDALRKYQAEIEASTRDKLKDELSEKTHTLEAEKRITVRRNQEEIHAMYEEYLIAAQRELEQRLQVKSILINYVIMRRAVPTVIRLRSGIVTGRLGGRESQAQQRTAESRCEDAIRYHARCSEKDTASGVLYRCYSPQRLQAVALRAKGKDDCRLQQDCEVLIILEMRTARV